MPLTDYLDKGASLDPDAPCLLFPSDPSRPEKRYDRARAVAGDVVGAALDAAFTDLRRYVVERHMPAEHSVRHGHDDVARALGLARRHGRLQQRIDHRRLPHHRVVGLLRDDRRLRDLHVEALDHVLAELVVLGEIADLLPGEVGLDVRAEDLSIDGVRRLPPEALRELGIAPAVTPGLDEELRNLLRVQKSLHG